MAIHHDKPAYGKLAPSSEELSEERLNEMLARLNGTAENEEERADKTESPANKKYVRHKRKN